MSETFAQRSGVPLTPDFQRAPDALSRFPDEQVAAIRARAPLVTLSAGAGSGKTTVLVERFIDLVQREGVSPLRILAITFTEKAAAEMKERIVRRFEAQGDEDNRRRAEAAYISTIHGFCARLLRENPLAARLDPAFRVMDELTRNIFLDEHLEALYANDGWYVETERRFPGGYRLQRPMLFELITDAALLPAEFGTLGTGEERYSVEEHVAAAVRRVRQYWQGQWTEARRRLLEIEPLITGLEIRGKASAAQHGQLCDLLGRLHGAAEPNAQMAAEFCDLTQFTRGIRDEAAAAAVKEVFEAVRKVLSELSKLDFSALEHGERTIYAPLKVGIYERARRLREAYAEFKRHHGFLDFEDLQTRALALLEDSAIRDTYGARFSHVLLDEAQDTNAVQMRLVERLRHAGQSLFAVGDVKQAIYGFRGANVDIFRNLCSDASPSDRGRGRDDGSVRLSLRDNYRSRDGIIAFVNEVGRRLWNDGSLAYEPLVPRFDYRAATDVPQVELHIVEQGRVPDEDGNPKREPTDVVREREAISIAHWIRTLVDRAPGDAFMVYDRDTRGYRPVRYGDIAILTGTRTPFPNYEAALADFGVPFVKDGGTGFFTGPEVRDLLAALRVIANPLDDVSLLAVLRSPLFGWDDADLVRLKNLAGKRRLWHALARGLEPRAETAAPDTLATLLELRRWAPLVSPAALIGMVCEATAYRAALLCLPRGRAQVANIDKLVEFARTAASLDGPSLAAFLHRAELAERYLERETDAPLSVTGDDVVVLSTIHGAKGLEWPIVMLASLETNFARWEGGSRYVAADGALVVRPKGEDGKTIDSPASKPLADAEKAREEAEGRRLLYVGMTRARERLVLSGQYDYRTNRSRKPGLAAPMDWLAGELGIAAPGDAPTRATLGGAALAIHFISAQHVGPMRDDARASHDRDLARARAAVRAGQPVEWRPGSSDAEDSVTKAAAVVERVLGAGGAGTASQVVPAVTTVTQLVYFFRCPLVYWFDLVLQIDEHPRARGQTVGGARGSAPRRLSALDRGTKVHELLERANFDAPPHAEARRLMEAADGIPAEERPKIEGMLAKVLADPLLDRARSARRVEREYPFHLDVGGTRVEGVIDLVFEDADGRGVVVDYKSNDLAAPKRLETLSALYRPQIELYALAARRAGVVVPEEATLYFLNKAHPVTTPVDTRRLEVVEAQTHDALGRIAAGDWSTEPGEKCRGCGYRKRGFCEVGRRFEG